MPRLKLPGAENPVTKARDFPRVNSSCLVVMFRQAFTLKTSIKGLNDSHLLIFSACWSAHNTGADFTVGCVRFYANGLRNAKKKEKSHCWRCVG